ncbi:MAG: heat shock protein DnaJ domain protein [Labilithrix sp.]|nr:heat shock protein DnaJ domain protein [Labilithrix sp.]
MAAPSTFIVWAESLETMHYYDILRVAPDAQPAEIQKAFQDLALRCHPDRFVDEPVEVGQAATAVFKRLVEAYSVLRRPQLRARYDAELRKAMASANGAQAPGGAATKFDEHAVAQKPKFEQRTLYMIARNAKAKQFAAKADRFLSNGQLEEARIQIISAYQHDPGNDELKERLDILYEALALEPP